MRMHRIVGLLGAVVVSQFALAEESAPDPKVLGTTEAILAYCVKADPSGASRFQEGIQLITQGASDESLAKVRMSEDYRQARDLADESLANVDARNAAKVCSQSLAQSE
jgi:hypothetical protein